MAVKHAHVGITADDPAAEINKAEWNDDHVIDDGSFSIAKTTGLQTALNAKQPLDSDLTEIADLTPTNNDVIQRKAGAWTNSTMSTIKTDLVLVKGDVGLSNVDNTSDANKPISLATQTALNAKQAIVAGVDDTEIGYLNGVTSGIQAQIDGKSSTGHTHVLTSGATDVTASAAEVNILDGATLDVTELNYVDGVTSSIQTQLDGKQITITGAATTIDTEDLTANRALLSDASGKVVVSAVVTNTELEYLDGVTSGIQAQIDGKAVTGHTHTLASGATDVTSTAAELNILDGATLDVTELNYVDGVTSSIQTQLDGKSATGHTHVLSSGATDVTSSAAEVNILDGATLDVTELNYVDGVTSGIQAQIDAKGIGDMVLASVQTVTGAKTFNSSKLLIRNPANDSSYTIVGGAIVADRNITLPLLTSNDIIVTEDFAQTLINKILGTGTVFSVIPTINDGITFTFNPSATVAGINVGALSGDPSSLVNADIWYDSTAGKFRAREGGVSKDIIGGSSTHNLLSATHPDTLAGTVVRGDIIVGNTTPAWARVAKGADGTVLQSNSTDALWRTSLKLAEIAAPTSPSANQIEIYAFDNAVGAQIRAKDEYGLIDILSDRDNFRSRKPFSIGLGSDLASTGTDLLAVGIATSSLSGTISNVAADVDGQRKNFATAASANADAGFPPATGNTMLSMNPDVTIKFKIVSTAVRRVWIGWTETDQIASDSTPATHKFALRLSTSAANVNFCMVHSDGTNETITQVAVADAAIHTIRLIGDTTNSRWGYSFDGAVVTWVSVNVPTTSQIVSLECEIRTLEAVAKNMDLWFVEGSTEK